MTSAPPMLRVVHIATQAATIRAFLIPHIVAQKSEGHDVTVIASGIEDLRKIGAETSASWFNLPLTREITPFSDTIALLRLSLLLRRLKPDVVHLHTPKAALLGALAARLAGAPLIIFTIHGLISESAASGRNRLLYSLEKLTALLSHEVHCVSPSLRDRVIELKIGPESKTFAFGAGSISGIDTQYFAPSEQISEQARALRAELQIPQESVVVGYLGRLTEEKGISDLALAWREISERAPRAQLLLVGNVDDSRNGRPRHLPDGTNAHYLPWQEDVRPALAAMDIVVLPSHREGFGMTLLEASAMAKPTIASRTVGCVDAVIHEHTGILVDACSPSSLAAAILRLIEEPHLRERLGNAGRMRAIESFNPSARTAAVLERYNQRYAHKPHASR